jgi:thiol-disulfide isomerase/thioredoxin
MKPKGKSVRVISIVALVFLAGVFLAACNGDDTSNTNTPVISAPPRTALPMPPLNGRSLGDLGWNLANGSRATVSQQQGKVLILDFYATWCLPCRESIPHLVELQHRYEKDLSVVGLNVGGPDDLAEVPNFANEFKIQYPLGVPENELVSLLLADSDAIPQTFIFDRKGQLIERFVGFGETTGEAINQVVEKAVQSSAE